MEKKPRKPQKTPVYLRIRPLQRKETPGTLEVHPSFVSLRGKMHSFPRAIVSMEGNQEDTYNIGELAAFVDDFIKGMDINILAYGQTGSGKTHTVFGPPGYMERAGKGEFGTTVIPEYGLFPRVVFQVFDQVQKLKAQGEHCVLCVSAVELQWEVSMDLLYGKCPSYIDSTVTPNELYGQTKLVLSCPQDMLRLFAALATRNSASTKMNATSSRSHCFASLYLYTLVGEDKIRRCRFQFVDMAGSERIVLAHGVGAAAEARSGDPADQGVMRVFEGMSTNWSLVMLSRCVREVCAMRDPSKMATKGFFCDLIPLLHSSLIGSARTILYVMLSPAGDHDSQSMNALDFGLQFSGLRMFPKQRAVESITNRQRSISKQLKESKEWVKKGVKGKYAEKRHAQVRAFEQALHIMKLVTSTERKRKEEFVFPDSMFSYHLREEWEMESAQMQRYVEELDEKEWLTSKPIDEERKEMEEYFLSLGANSKINKRYLSMQSVQEVVIDGKAFGTDLSSLLILVHTCGKERKGRRAIVYFHGGGCCIGSARGYSNAGLLARYAKDNDAVVFNVDYRLSPEVQVPKHIMDGCAAVRFVAAHAAKYGADPHRIAVVGESGGGYVAVGVAMELAKQGESDCIRLLVPIAPMTTNLFQRCTRAQLKARSLRGLRLDLHKLEQNRLEKRMVTNMSKHKQDPYLFPNLMPPSIASKMPMTVVMTSEFDFLRIAATELATLLHRHGRLLDFVIHPSTTHCWYFMMDRKLSRLFWNDSQKIFAKWL